MILNSATIKPFSGSTTKCHPLSSFEKCKYFVEIKGLVSCGANVSLILVEIVELVVCTLLVGSGDFFLFRVNILLQKQLGGKGL